MNIDYFLYRGSTINVPNYEKVLPGLWVHEKDILFILELVEILGLRNRFH
jgi:hypothetical protein